MERRFLVAFILVSLVATAAVMLLRQAVLHGGIVPAALGVAAALVGFLGLVVLGRLVVVSERAARGGGR